MQTSEIQEVGILEFNGCIANCPIEKHETSLMPVVLLIGLFFVIKKVM